MSLTYRNIGLLAEVSQTAFKTNARQELSTQTNGVVRAKNFSTALWMASYSTAEIRNSIALGLEAEVDQLQGPIVPFEAWDVRRPTPLLYRDGSANDGFLLSVNDDNRRIALSDLLPGQIISKGDYLSFDYGQCRALHRVSQTVTANEEGDTAEFEVWPHLRSGWELEADVNLKAPRGLFRMMPGTFDPKSSRSFFSTMSLSAIQYFPP